MSRTRARAMRVEERGLKAVATTNTELIYLVEATCGILSKKKMKWRLLVGWKRSLPSLKQWPKSAPSTHPLILICNSSLNGIIFRRFLRAYLITSTSAVRRRPPKSRDEEGTDVPC